MVTFSPLLRATLQDTGENPNTWGSVANNGVFLKLEAGIAGVATLNVNTAADITLTANNGTADQASNMVLKLEGGPTTNIDVIIPNSTKMYLVDGTAFTGANTITVTTNSGTGVAFTAGQRGVVYTDGTNTFLIAQPSTETIPAGLIAMWGGTIASIPSGWSLCNGTGATPDLRNRFIIAADADNGSVPTTSITALATITGGSKDININTGAGGNHNHGASTLLHTLTIAQIPPHTHRYIASVLGSDISGLTASANNITQRETDSVGGGQGHSHGILDSGTHVHTVTSTNGNLPPYYALAFIQKD